jgi:hypothetical protein
VAVNVTGNFTASLSASNVFSATGPGSATFSGGLVRVLSGFADATLMTTGAVIQLSGTTAGPTLTVGGNMDDNVALAVFGDANNASLSATGPAASLFSATGGVSTATFSGGLASVLSRTSASLTTTGSVIQLTGGSTAGPTLRVGGEAGDKVAITVGGYATSSLIFSTATIFSFPSGPISAAYSTSFALSPPTITGPASLTAASLFSATGQSTAIFGTSGIGGLALVDSSGGTTASLATTGSVIQLSPGLTGSPVLTVGGDTFDNVAVNVTGNSGAMLCAGVSSCGGAPVGTAGLFSATGPGSATFSGGLAFVDSGVSATLTTTGSVIQLTGEHRRPLAQRRGGFFRDCGARRLRG